MTTQLAHSNERIKALTASKKRKKMKVDSNKKLADFRDILHTQEAQELERIKKENRAKRQSAKAKKAAKDAK